MKRFACVKYTKPCSLCPPTDSLSFRVNLWCCHYNGKTPVRSRQPAFQKTSAPIPTAGSLLRFSPCKGIISNMLRSHSRCWNSCWLQKRVDLQAQTTGFPLPAERMCKNLPQGLKKVPFEQSPSLHPGHSSQRTTAFTGTVRNAMSGTLGQCSESLEQWKQLRNLMHPIGSRRALCVKCHQGKSSQGHQMSYRHGTRLSLPLTDHTEEQRKIKQAAATLFSCLQVTIQDTGKKEIGLPT